MRASQRLASLPGRAALPSSTSRRVDGTPDPRRPEAYGKIGQEAVLDPWIALTALVLSTSTLTLGVLALPLARHQPWLTALRLANLDQASGGRIICVVGLGYSERDFAAFGQASAKGM